MFRGVSTGIELTFYSSLNQAIGIAYHQIQGVNALIKVVLDLVEVALIFVRNLLGYVAFADTINILSGNINRGDEGVDQFVNTLQHHFVLTVKLVNFCSLVEPAVYCGLNQSLNLFEDSGIARS